MVMAVERTRSGKYSPVSATALGMAPPTPMPVRKRKAMSIPMPVELTVRKVSAPKAAVEATTMRLWPKRAEKGDRNR